MPPLKIAVLVETPAWRERLPTVAAHVRKFARAAVKAALADGVPAPNSRRPWALTVLLADDADLRALNRDFRGKDKPTNVLSFPAWEAGPAGTAGARGAKEAVNLGDIALSFGVTAKESLKQNKSLADHLAHLTVHGVLHVFGYDHLDQSQADDMESLERAVLARHGIADPYVLRPARKAAPRARKQRGRTR
ncbi:MAG: rRNA maturation RNase YbeY [Alphaproteobacteria bacterium]